MRPRLKAILSEPKAQMTYMGSVVQNKAVTWLLFMLVPAVDGRYVNLRLFRNGIKLRKSSYWLAWDRKDGRLVISSYSRLLRQHVPEVYVWASRYCLESFGSEGATAELDESLVKARVIPIRRKA